MMLEDNTKVLSIQDQDEIFFGSAYAEYNKQSKGLVLRDINIVIQPEIDNISVYLPHTDYFIEKYLEKNIQSVYHSSEEFFRDLLQIILDDADAILEHIMHDIQDAKRDHRLHKNPYTIMEICSNALLNLDTLNLVIQKMKHLMVLINRHIPQFKEHESDIADQINGLATDISYASTIAHTISESLNSLYSLKKTEKVHAVEVALTLVFVVELILSTIKFLDIHFPFIERFVAILSGGTVFYILYYFFKKE
jgi:hypothetical protein